MHEGSQKSQLVYEETSTSGPPFMLYQPPQIFESHLDMLVQEAVSEPSAELVKAAACMEGDAFLPILHCNESQSETKPADEAVRLTVEMCRSQKAAYIQPILGLDPSRGESIMYIIQAGCPRVEEGGSE